MNETTKKAMKAIGRYLELRGCEVLEEGWAHGDDRVDYIVDDAGEVVEGVTFDGGCNGNLKAIGLLIEGRPVDEVVEVLAGNTCGPRKTSCADQLTLGLREAQEALRAGAGA